MSFECRFEIQYAKMRTLGLCVSGCCWLVGWLVGCCDRAAGGNDSSRGIEVKKRGGRGGWRIGRALETRMMLVVAWSCFDGIEGGGGGGGGGSHGWDC